MQVQHNLRDMRRLMESRASAVARELRRENVEIAKDLTAESQRLLQADVYAVPVKTSRTGRPLWRRTGELKAADRWVAQGMAVLHRNKAAHYPHRHRYGKPGGRPASPPQRASYWVTGAVARQARSIRARRRAAIARAWQRP